MPKVTPEDIDALLPQTQCGLCTHKGCMPYAEAIVFENEKINRCLPGGIPLLRKLGNLLDQDTSHLDHELQQTAVPNTLAIIREDECIGCTKCIKACPVDAIIGAAKSMHTVISDECSGCELCVPACPVDCIDLAELSPAKVCENDTLDYAKAKQFRDRFNQREIRLTKERQEKNKRKQNRTKLENQKYIQAALQRVKGKSA